MLTGASIAMQKNDEEVIIIFYIICNGRDFSTLAILLCIFSFTSFSIYQAPSHLATLVEIQIAVPVENLKRIFCKQGLPFRTA